MINYKDAVSYIEEIPKFTKKHSLNHTKEFLKRLNEKTIKSKILHVAGTNGKGSVCAYLQAILVAEGKKVGFFTSPHLVTMTERIRINGIFISEEDFLHVFLKVRKVAEEMEAEELEYPSYFEFLFGMGMVYFDMRGVEYIILETGLGGRLDATNSVEEPLVSIITSISLDHTEILGNTIEEIATEKAGIIKEGIPVFCDATNEKAKEVIRSIADKKGAVCREISKNAYEIREITDKHIAFSRLNAYDEDIVWNLANPCAYQIVNALLAIETAEYIFGGQAGKELWRDALACVCWEGRMEEVLPNVYVDGAHNVGAVEAFIESVNIRNRVSGKNGALPVVLFSAVCDKDYERMIALLCQKLPAKTYIVTEIEDKRRIPAEELRRVFEKYTTNKVVVEPGLEKAWHKAMEERKSKEEMYCIGSLYLVGMIKELIDRRQTDA